MPKTPPYSRISITLPAPVLAGADKLARRLDRSRSWVIAEAIRRFGNESAGVVAAPPRAVHEPVTLPYGVLRTGLGDSRLAQLEADLKLTPEQRVRAGEDTQRTSQLLRGSPHAQRLQFFDRYQDYLEWQRNEGILG